MKKAKNLIMVVVILASMTIPVVAGATASIHLDEGTANTTSPTNNSKLIRSYELQQRPYRLV